MLERLARFLELEPSGAWLDAAHGAMRTKRGYEHDAALVAHYRRGVESRFAGQPAFADALLAFRP